MRSTCHPNESLGMEFYCNCFDHLGANSSKVLSLIHPLTLEMVSYGQRWPGRLAGGSVSFRPGGAGSKKCC